jgi:acetoin utilization deacetylase AcuC-like enzyme
MAPPVLFHHPAALGHDTGAHPERAARLVAILRALEARDWLGYELRSSPQVTRTQLEAVHDPAYIDRIERFCAAGGGLLDADTVASTGSWEAALHGAGGATGLVDALLTGEAPGGASLHRPPGHHALADRAMGFCLFNNVAVAARHALDAHGLERVMVVDWDVHHGNGTNDLFHGHPEVLFVSIHQYPWWPGTGGMFDVGSDAGRGFTVNLPVDAGTGDATWTSLVEHVVAPLAQAYRPQLVLLSAGFDAHADDPLSECLVSDDGYAAMAGSLRRAADGLRVPLGLVLEGGYDLRSLARSVVTTLEVLGAEEPPPAPAIEFDAVAQAALERLQETWPGLGEAAAPEPEAEGVPAPEAAPAPEGSG